jgi:isopentenyl phosphate kinase
MTELIFLKLGGSLITDKEQAYIVRQDTLKELAQQIAAFLEESQQNDVRLLLGHGSGSFGHTPASEHGTRQGVSTAAGWRGFAEVHYQAGMLNHFVMEELQGAGIAALPFQPSAAVISRDGKVASWPVEPLQAALDHHILPVIYGDVIFDQGRGGTILSTEDLFKHLARLLRPRRILLAGLEEGVWGDFPARTRLLSQVTRETFRAIEEQVGAAAGVDVTGGMQAKVEEMLQVVESVPGLEVTIFSAQGPGNLLRALRGEALGTKITL